MTWTINGTDPKTAYGLAIESVDGWADDVAEVLPTLAVPGRPGLLIANPTPVVAPRKLTARGLVYAATAAALRTALDNLAAVFTPGIALTVAFADRTTRQLTAYVEGMKHAPPAASMIAAALPVEIALTCPDPYFYDSTPTTVALTAGGVALPLGTGPVRPVITLTDAATTPVFTLTDRNAATVGSLGINVTMVAGDVLVIDCSKQTITLNGVSRMDLLASGDFFKLEPLLIAAYLTASWPKLACSSGTASVSYNKAWR